jgi:predicted O-methyltransferase YrrM
MFTSLRRAIGRALRYRPLPDTASVRAAIEAASVPGLPYCPPDEGDLIYSAIRRGKFTRCLETGFHTGSTALYMCAAIAGDDGEAGEAEDGESDASVVSICIDDDESIQRGVNLLEKLGVGGHHKLIRANSNKVLAEMFLAGERFDFIFIDGWKTFDHLAYEIYLYNQMLEKGGIIVFDDSWLPSIQKIIILLQRFYGYRELDYAQFNQSKRLRLWHILTMRSFRRPYRGVEKMLDTSEQAPIQDWTFHRKI